MRRISVCECHTHVWTMTRPLILCEAQQMVGGVWLGACMLLFLRCPVHTGPRSELHHLTNTLTLTTRTHTPCNKFLGIYISHQYQHNIITSKWKPMWCSALYMFDICLLCLPNGYDALWNSLVYKRSFCIHHIRILPGYQTLYANSKIARFHVQSPTIRSFHAFIGPIAPPLCKYILVSTRTGNITYTIPLFCL